MQFYGVCPSGLGYVLILCFSFRISTTNKKLLCASALRFPLREAIWYFQFRPEIENANQEIIL